MNPLWKGSLAIHEQPHSPRWVTTTQGETITRVYRGPFEALLAERPAPGVELSDLPGIRVDSVDLVPDGAGTSGPGTMTIVATNDAANVIYEVEWTLLERDIRTHPYYGLILPSQWAALARWETEEDPDLRGAGQYTKPDGSIGSLTGLIAGLAGKMLRGQESYIMPTPVARRTTRSATKPTTTQMGTVQNPPEEIGAPAGYQWLKTADRAIRQGTNGKWERIEEWTGAFDWDADLYPAVL